MKYPCWFYVFAQNKKDEEDEESEEEEEGDEEGAVGGKSKSDESSEEDSEDDEKVYIILLNYCRETHNVSRVILEIQKLFTKRFRFSDILH